MRWRLPWALLAVGLAGMLAGPGLGASSGLRVTYWPHGRLGPKETWQLACAPARGTHPRPGLACLELRRFAAELAPPTRPCTFLEPRNAPVAAVSGSYGGRSYDRLVRPACDSRAWHDLHALLTGR